MALSNLACKSGFILLLCTACLSASDLYVVHGGANQTNPPPNAGELAIVDLATGALTSLGQPVPGTSLTGLAYDGSSLWVSTSNLTLVNVDLAGNAISGEIPFSGANFSSQDRIQDLAFDPVSGMLFAAGLDRADDFTRFYSVDPATGALTLVGDYNSCSVDCDNLSIAFDGTGTMYVHETNGPDFDTINPANGAVVSTVSGGIPGGALGLGYNPMDGLLYGTECCDADNDPLTPPNDGGRIYSIDPATGASNIVVDFNDNRYIQDVAFVPEPSSVSLLLISLAGVSMFRRRRR